MKKVSFELTPALARFVEFGCSTPFARLGEVLPISIGMRFSWCQSIKIFPQAGYSFFTFEELRRIHTLAEVNDLILAIRSFHGVPVIEVSHYFKS